MKKHLLSLAILSLAVVGLTSCGNMENKTDDMVTKNKETTKKIFEAFDKGDPEAVNGLVAEDCIEHTPDPEMTEKGLAGMKQMMMKYHTAFPDMKNTIYSMTAEGDMVTVHYNMKGTNSGPMGTMPATNKTIDVDGVDVIRYKDGIAQEHWGYSQEMKMMTQLGMMNPTPPTAEAAPAEGTATPEQEKK